MNKQCTGTGYDIDYCRVEKMGCEGCDHFREGGTCNEQKTSECPKNKSN